MDKAFNRNMLIIQLRALVLALGESTDPPWWNTKFMTDTGIRFLERLYPRVPMHAAVHSSGKAACDAHDKAVGRVGVYHLFRFPDHIENALTGLVSSEGSEFFNSFRKVLNDRQGLLDLLLELCNGKTDGDFAVNSSGPLGMGSESEVEDMDTLTRIAAIYYQSFMRGVPSYPYFTSHTHEERTEDK